MNNGNIVGRLTKNPELMATQSGKELTTITLACNNSKDDTTFLEITAFGKLAETIVQYTKKGDLLGANYIVKNYTWEDKEGKKHHKYRFIANKISFLHSVKEEKKEEIKEEKQLTMKTDPYAEFGNKVSITAKEIDDLPF